MKICLLIALLLMMCPPVAPCAESGSLGGTVRDAETGFPLAGATIRIVGTSLGAITNRDGSFDIALVPPGRYTISCSLIGYLAKLETETVVLAHRKAVVDVSLTSSAKQSAEIVVQASAFDRGAAAGVSRFDLNAEEVRRMPSGVGDVSRILTNTVSAVQTEDQSNDLIVRGGAPAETGFYIDGVFTPNINHFPQQGASGGNVSILNLDFVSNLTLMAGGFDATFGDRASGMVDIRLREGSRQGLRAQADLTMTGLGTSLEGPIGQGGSFMLSARHSWLDAIVALLDVGKAPNFGDVQGKLVLDIDSTHKLSAIGIQGLSSYSRTRSFAIEDQERTYGDERYSVGTYGLTWNALWNTTVVTQTTIGHATIRTSSSFKAVENDSVTEDARTTDDVTNLRSVTTWLASDATTLDAGLEVRHRSTSAVDPVGLTIQPLQNLTASVFASLRHRIGLFSVVGGLRLTHIGTLNQSVLDPRLSLTYMALDNLWATVAVGTYQQELPPFLLGQQSGVTLLSPYAFHTIASITWLPTSDLRVTLEGYRKTYERFPMSTDSPHAFVLDAVQGDRTSFPSLSQLESSGRATVAGLEFSIQKRLADRWTGLLGGTLTSSRYRDIAQGQWRRRTFDVRAVATGLIGYAPSDAWMFSVRAVMAGGQAATPVDLDASMVAGRTIRLDEETNTVTLPAYFSMSARADKRWSLGPSTLTTFLMVVNVTNRRNVRAEVFNATLGRIVPDTMWGIIPVFGIDVDM